MLGVCWCNNTMGSVRDMLAMARPLGDLICDDGTHVMRRLVGEVYECTECPILEGYANAKEARVECRGNEMTLWHSDESGLKTMCRFGVVLCPDMGCVVVDKTVVMSETWHTWGRTWVEDYSTGEERGRSFAQLALCMVFDPRKVKLETDLGEVVSRKRKEVVEQVSCLAGVLPAPALKAIGQSLRPGWVNGTGSSAGARSTADKTKV